MPYTIGLDFGTDSLRVLVVDVDSGEEVGMSVAEYKRWKRQKYCNPLKNQFRQHPQDYICLLYTSPSPQDRTRSRMPSSA